MKHFEIGVQIYKPHVVVYTSIVFSRSSKRLGLEKYSNYWSVPNGITNFMTIAYAKHIAMPKRAIPILNVQDYKTKKLQNENAIINYRFANICRSDGHEAIVTANDSIDMICSHIVDILQSKRHPIWPITAIVGILETEIETEIWLL